MTNEAFFRQVEAAAEGRAGIHGAATAAHASNESNFGKSLLSSRYNNLWGIKATDSWTGESVELPTWEEVDGKPVSTTARFRVYQSLHSCLADYAAIVARTYPWAAKHSSDPLAFLTGIFLIGPYRWATDSGAYLKVVRILDQYSDLTVRRAPVRQVVINGWPRLELAWKVLTTGTPYVPLGAHMARWQGDRIDVTRPEGGEA